MAEKADKIESQLDELIGIDDIPDEVLSGFVEETQDFFDAYVTARVEQKTLQEMAKEGDKEDEEDDGVKKAVRHRRRRLGENLPDNVAFLIKNANSEYLNGNFNRAISFAKEAIEENPRAPEPYNILSLISEEMDSPDTALTFLVKAAERSTDSAELWSECARISKQLGRLPATTSYLKKAAKANPTDTSALLELYDLLNTQNDDTRTLTWTLGELCKRDPTNGRYASELSVQQYQSGKVLEALQTLKASVDAQIDAGCEVSMENANLLASGYLNEAMNDEVIELDALFPDEDGDDSENNNEYNKNDENESNDDENNENEINEDENNENFNSENDENRIKTNNKNIRKKVNTKKGTMTSVPADFRVNCAVALIRKKDISSAKRKLSKGFIHLDPNMYQESFRLVADEMIRAGFLLDAADWLRVMQRGGVESREDIAYCLGESGLIDEAADELKSLIVDLSNKSNSNNKNVNCNIAAPTALFQLLHAAGREAEALEWLEANCPTGAQSDELVLKRATAAYDSGEIETFIELATPLLCRIFFDVYRMKLLSRDSKIVESILGLNAAEKMSPYMLRVMRYRRMNISSNSNSNNNSGLNMGFANIDEKEVFALASTCLLCLFSNKMYPEALVLGGLLVICREKLERRNYFDVLFIFSLVAFQTGDGASACAVMRSVLLENNGNDVVWEFFNVFIQKTPEEENNAHKFLIRTLTKIPDCAPLQLMLGNHSQSTVWFDHAITQYLNVYKDRPEEPIVSLLLSAAYLSKAYVRTQSNTRKSVLCAYACIKKYFEARCSDFPTEAEYNLARFYQTLKMYPHAERMYRKVLDEKVDYEVIADNKELHRERFSLKYDAAFNLALIYQESNPQEARRIYRKYLVIE